MPPDAAAPAADPRARDAPLAGRLADSPPGGRRYAVRAVWRTLQGEGFWAGRPAVFVRLVACNLWSGYERDRERDAARHGNGCARWCDTVFTPEGSVKLSADALTDEVVATGEPGGIRFAVLTGEPLLQADAPLVAALRARGFVVAVETNGTQTLAGAFGPDPAGWPDWVVCSPKLPDAQTVIEAVDEVKLVVPDYRPEAYAALAGASGAARRVCSGAYRASPGRSSTGCGGHGGARRAAVRRRAGSRRDDGPAPLRSLAPRR